MKPAWIILLPVAALFFLCGAVGRAQVPGEKAAADAKAASLAEAETAAWDAANAATRAMNNEQIAAWQYTAIDPTKVAEAALAKMKLTYAKAELEAAVAARAAAVARLEKLKQPPVAGEIVAQQADDAKLAEWNAAAETAAAAQSPAETHASDLDAAMQKKQAEVTDAALALKTAKEGGDSKTIDAAKTAMNAKIAELLEITTSATTAAKAAADAKLAAKETAAVLAKAQQDARDAAAQAKLAVLANAWFDASVAQSKKGHFIAVVQVQRVGKPYIGFRYDSYNYPALERVVG